MRSAESAHNQQPTDGGEESRFRRESSPPVAPQQPMQEALEAASEYLDDWFGLGQWPPVHRFPELLVGFAAQRVTRLSTAIEHWRQEVGKLHSLVDRRTKERDQATAATAKARREALIEAAQFCEDASREASHPVWGAFCREFRDRLRALANAYPVNAKEARS